jgi:hypothetical protein
MIFVDQGCSVSAYGFLASQEVKDAGVGNLGLQDRKSNAKRKGLRSDEYQP